MPLANVRMEITYDMTDDALISVVDHGESLSLTCPAVYADKGGGWAINMSKGKWKRTIDEILKNMASDKCPLCGKEK